MVKFYVALDTDGYARMSRTKEIFENIFLPQQIVEVKYPSSVMNVTAAMAYWRARYSKISGQKVINLYGEMK